MGDLYVYVIWDSLVDDFSKAIHSTSCSGDLVDFHMQNE